MKDYPVTDPHGQLLGRLTLTDTFIDRLEHSFPDVGFTVSVDWVRTLEDDIPKIVGFAFISTNALEKRD